jgi:Spy/CpxP family protein refolding chaperone
MKLKIATTIAMLALAMPVLIPGSALQAQESSESRPKAQSPDQVVKMYDSKLSLTDEQKQKLRPIIANRQQQMLDLRSDSSVKGREKMKKMKSVMDSSDSRINAVLNPDQRKKYAEFEQERREKMKERMEEKREKN